MKTALDFYERGKLKESSADEYNANSYYAKNRFICPECGEAVHIRPSKYANFFGHYKRTDSTAECDRRVDGVPTSSIYERIGLPIYLRQRNDSKFDLYLSCKAIPDKVMDDAEKNCIIFSVDGKMKYSVTRERFSTEKSVLLQLMHIPSNGQKYTIDITPADKSFALYQHWSNYADGFSSDGALFSVTDNGGKKIRHGDNIYTETEYYWIRRQGQFPGYVNGIDMKIQGTLELPDRKWYVFRGKFLLVKEDSAFNFLISYLRENLKVHLLEKRSEIIPIWPPIAKCDEGYLVGEKINKIYGCVVSGNIHPQIYSYSGIAPVPQELACKDGLVKLHFKGTDTFINVDRKYISTGVLLSPRNKNFVSSEKKEPLFVNSNAFRISEKEYKIKSNYLKLLNTDCVEYVLVSNSGELYKKVAQDNEIISDLKSDERLFFLKHKHLFLTVKVELEKIKINTFNEKIIIECIKKYSCVSKIGLPVNLRVKMHSANWRTSDVKRYVEEVLKSNRISVPMIKVMEGIFDEIIGS